VHVVPDMVTRSLSNPDPRNRRQLLLQCTALYRVCRAIGCRNAYHLLWGLRQSCLHRQHDLYPRAGCRSVLSRNSRQNAAGLGMGFCLKLHRSDAVILAVTNVKRAALDEDAVRPLEAASESIAVRAIAAVAGPDDGRNYSRSQIDASNDMAFRVIRRIDLRTGIISTEIGRAH